MPEDGQVIAPVDGRLERARGRASVTLDEAGRLTDLWQSGSAKVFLPHIHGAAPEVVFLNTAGGLTGGDALRYELAVGEGAMAVATTQTAERAYASVSGDARMDVGLGVGQGASLDWLPQETILFDASTLMRRTTVAMGRGARLLMAEMVVLGRAAMGETLRALAFEDRREVRREGRLVHLEPLRITSATLRAGPGALGGNRAVATVVLLAQGAEDALGPVRAVLGPGLEVAASAWDGRLVLRAAGPDLLVVKRIVARVLGVLRGGPLPRVWQI